MIRYKIEVETLGGIRYLKKEYYTYPQALKARRLINFSKYGDCVIRIYKFVNEVRTLSVSTVIGGHSKDKSNIIY